MQFSHQIFIYFKLLKNTNVLIKTFHKPFRTDIRVRVVSDIQTLSSARVCTISDIQGRINHMAEEASAHGPRAFKGPALYSVLIFCRVAAWTKKGRQKPQGQ